MLRDRHYVMPSHSLHHRAPVLGLVPRLRVTPGALPRDRPLPRRLKLAGAALSPTGLGCQPPSANGQVERKYQGWRLQSIDSVPAMCQLLRQPGSQAAAACWPLPSAL